MNLARNFRNVAILLAVIAVAVIASIAASNHLKGRVSGGLVENFGATPRTSWVGQYLSGYHATKEKDYEKASEFFANSLNARSSNELLQTQAMSLLLVSGKFEEAVVIAKDLNRKSDNGLAKLTLIVDAIRDNRLDDAEKFAISDKDESGTVINKVISAWIKYAKNQPQEAAEILKAMQGDEVFLPFINYNYALISNLSGDKAKAAELYATLLNQPQLSNRIASSAYNFYEEQNDTAKMELIVKKYHFDPKLKKHPAVTNVKEGVSEALLGVGGIIMTQYSPDKSAALFRLALFLNPKLDDAKLLLGSILMNEGDYKSANEILNQIGQDSYLGDYAKLAIAKNFEAMDQNAKARQYFENLVKNPDTQIDAYVSLGDLSRKDENYAEAAEFYTKALEAAKSKAKNSNIESKYWAIYFARGVCYERLKDYDKSEADLNEALKLQPNQPDVLNYLAYTWIDSGRNLEKAIQMVMRAHEEKPEDPQIIDSVGWGLFKLGNYEGAVEYLEAAASLLPYDPTVNDHLGDAYWITGRQNEARFQWERALRNEPGKELEASLKQKLENGILKVAKDENIEKSAQ